MDSEVQMIPRVEEYTWLVVGCGGTFYVASPYLAVLYRRSGEGQLMCMDPDVIEKDNLERQWPGWPLGVPKAYAAANVLTNGRDKNDSSLALPTAFDSHDPLLEERTGGKPVLAVVNVDNDSARHQVAEWLAARREPGAMVVSGCERTYGQCYSGLWLDGEAVHDWRREHPDVSARPTEESRPEGERCQLQDVRANALTGVLVGMCIEDVAGRLDGGVMSRVREFYWSLKATGERGRTLCMWDMTVVCNGEVL